MRSESYAKGMLEAALEEYKTAWFWQRSYWRGYIVALRILEVPEPNTPQDINEKYTPEGMR
jgi:hypothetical protein